MDAQRYIIEPYRAGSDEIGAITALLHRAHAPLAAAGMNYLAATQPDDVTEARLASAASSWLAKEGREIIGIITYYSDLRGATAPVWFRRSDVGVFAQFGVEPAFQKRGIGRDLLATVERYAKEHGKSELACDTAEGATHLRDYYARRGFREVATHSYLDANYASVILSKTLNGDS